MAGVEASARAVDKSRGKGRAGKGRSRSVGESRRKCDNTAKHLRLVWFSLLTSGGI